ncbi:MAG: type IV pilin N-terminal domain-containing protein, partial [Candidatus Thermoplasmatota archaeon]
MKLYRNRLGVSDVVANILILAITVALFGSIVLWIQYLPTPEKTPHNDFKAKLEFVDNCAKIKVTMLGGPTLSNETIEFYLFINDTRNSLSMYDGLGKDKWAVGETWTYENCSIGANSNVSLTIVSTKINAILYSSVLLGAWGNFPPIVMERYTSPSIPYSGQTFKIYANIKDVDEDIDRVYIETPSGPYVQMTTDDNVTFVSGPYIAQLSWDGLVLDIEANDKKGNVGKGRITLDIQAAPGGGGGGG